MDITDYFNHRQRELAQNSVATDDMQFELAPDGQTGRMWGKVDLTDDVYVSVFERVEIREGTIEVVKYSYYVIAGGEELAGFDKDPSHDPPVHGHVGPDHARVEVPEISLEQALERGWAEVEMRATTYPPSRFGQAS